MDFLWSPWRYEYVSAAAEQESCVFCVGDETTQDAGKLILHRGERSFIILNLFPYTSGHLMVTPFAHVGTLTGVDRETLDEMTGFSRRAVEVLEEVYRPEGFNLGMNLGKCAGAGVRDHIHYHVVPRWCGDTNFMTVTGETRLLPEDIRATYEKLKPLFSP